MLSGIRVVGTIFLASLSVDVLGRVALLTTTIAVRAVARGVVWASRIAAASAGYGVGVASRYAADYLESRCDIATGKLLSWSEVEQRIVIERESITAPRET